MTKFTISQKELKNMVEKSACNVNKKATLSILTTVKIDVVQTGIIFSTQNNAHLCVTGEAWDIVVGKFCVGLETMKQIAKLKCDCVTFKHDAEGGKLHVKAGKKTLEFINAHNVNDFPKMPMMNGYDVKAFYRGKASDLAETFKKLSIYLDKQGNNKMLQSYLFCHTDKTIYALDGHRIGLRNTNSMLDNGISQVIHIDSYMAMQKCIEKNDNDIVLYTDGENIQAISDGFVCTFKNVEGQYFKVREMIDCNFSHSALVNNKELLESAGYISQLVKGSKIPLVIASVENEFAVYGVNADCKNIDIIECKENAIENNYCMAFTPSFIADMCSTIDCDYIDIRLNNPKSPMLCSGKEYSVLLLPVYFSNSENVIDSIKTILNK